MNKVFRVNLDGWAGEPEFFIIVAKDEEEARKITEKEDCNNLNIRGIKEISTEETGLHTISNSCC